MSLYDPQPGDTIYIYDDEIGATRRLKVKRVQSVGSDWFEIDAKDLDRRKKVTLTSHRNNISYDEGDE